jgi:transcriptional regulator with XRE-family HTH domain
VCLHHEGKSETAAEFFCYAYFAYALLRLTRQAEQVQKNADALFGVKIKTYGVESLHFDPPEDLIPIKSAGYEPAEHIGALIRQFRNQTGLKPKDVYHGLCDKGTYSRIERGQTKQANILLLESLLQRLGRDPNIYFTVFLDMGEFDERQIRDEITTSLGAVATDTFDKVEILLKDLAARDFYKHGLGLQYIKWTESSILQYKAMHQVFPGTEQEFMQQYADLLLEAIKITIPDFNEEQIERYRLTWYEASALMSLAHHYANMDELQRGTAMLGRLINSLNKSYADESVKNRILGAVQFNYATFLMHQNRFEEGLTVNGEETCIKDGQFYLLPLHARNNGWGLAELGRKDESIPYFAMAYYGSGLRGLKFDQDAINEYIEGPLGFVFEK